jgi:predicted sugar kinase
MNNRQKDSSSSFDLQQQPSKAKKKNKKYVTLKLLTTLDQQDLNQFIEYLKQLQDFHFMVKSNILYPLEIKKDR